MEDWVTSAIPPGFIQCCEAEELCRVLMTQPCVDESPLESQLHPFVSKQHPSILFTLK